MKTANTLQTLSFASLFAFAAGLGACSSEEGDDGDTTGDGDQTEVEFTFCAPADTCPPSVEGVDLDTPVSFTDDIYHPFLKPSCGGAGCHGSSSASAANLYFGKDDAPLDDAQIETLVAQLTTADSEIAPGSRNVVPGDWQASFLMAKLDGCQNHYSFACDADHPDLAFSVCDQACGDGMPVSEGDGSNPTPFATTAAEREVIHKVRAWIQQGAEYN